MSFIYKLPSISNVFLPRYMKSNLAFSLLVTKNYNFLCCQRKTNMYRYYQKVKTVHDVCCKQSTKYSKSVVFHARTSIVSGMIQSSVQLNDKVVIITGANTGIGYETALDLATRGAKVIMACRDLEKAENAKTKILEAVPDADLVVMKLDLASLASVRQFAYDVLETENRLDILINNAGIMMCPQWKTEDGFEMQLGVNHIGHFLLTNLLLDLLKKSAPSRIVVVSSGYYKRGNINWNDIMQEKNYDPLAAYAVSKLANVHHCLELSKRLEGTGVSCNVLHPGIVKTELGRYVWTGNHISLAKRIGLRIFYPIFSFFMKTPKAGAQTTIYCAIAPELQDVSGKYFGNCAEEALQFNVVREEDGKKLWKMSEEWIKEL